MLHTLRWQVPREADLLSASCSWSPKPISDKIQKVPYNCHDEKQQNRLSIYARMLLHKFLSFIKALTRSHSIKDFLHHFLYLCLHYWIKMSPHCVHSSIWTHLAGSLWAGLSLGCPDHGFCFVPGVSYAFCCSNCWARGSSRQSCKLKCRCLGNLWKHNDPWGIGSMGIWMKRKEQRLVFWTSHLKSQLFL